MAMVICSKCGSKIHHTARVCPRCSNLQTACSSGATEDAICLNDDQKAKDTIQRWRLAAAILSGLVILCIVAFNRPRLFSGFFPWVYYIFGPLVIAAVIVVVAARTKERKLNDRFETGSAQATARAARAKYSLLILLVLVIIFIGWIIWDSDYGYVYRQYFFHSKDELLLDFNRLEPINMTDANKTFKLNWFCRKENTQFGDFYCTDELLKWNNVSAMTVVFWYRDGVLTYAKIDVPRWCHDELIKYIHATYGPPHSYSARVNLRNILAGTSAIVRGTRGNTIIKEVNDLGIWQMDTGAFLVINLKKELNPFLWNTVFWISPAIVKSGEKQHNQKEFKK